IFDLEVSPDLTSFKEQLHQVLPGERALAISYNRDYLTLSGSVSSMTNLNQALSMAESYAPKKVINLLQVAGVQQVMLEVRIAEMNWELLRRLGVNATYHKNGNFGLIVLNNLMSLARDGP